MRQTDEPRDTDTTPQNSSHAAVDTFWGETDAWIDTPETGETVETVGGFLHDWPLPDRIALGLLALMFVWLALFVLA